VATTATDAADATAVTTIITALKGDAVFAGMPVWILTIGNGCRLIVDISPHHIDAPTPVTFAVAAKGDQVAQAIPTGIGVFGVGCKTQMQPSRRVKRADAAAVIVQIAEGKTLPIRTHRRLRATKEENFRVWRTNSLHVDVANTIYRV